MAGPCVEMYVEGIVVHKNIYFIYYCPKQYEGCARKVDQNLLTRSQIQSPRRRIFER